MPFVRKRFLTILTILIIGQQGYTGGVNGITDLRTLHGWDIRTDEAKYILYYINALLLFICLFVAAFVIKSKLGRLLVAMREVKSAFVSLATTSLASRFLSSAWPLRFQLSAVPCSLCRLALCLYLRQHRAFD